MALLDCLIKRVIPVNDAITFLSENCYPVNGHATSFSVINKSYFLQMPCSIKVFWKPIDEVNEFLENSPNVIISFTLITFLRGRPPWEKLNFVMESIILGNLLRVRSSDRQNFSSSNSHEYADIFFTSKKSIVATFCHREDV